MHKSKVSEPKLAMDWMAVALHDLCQPLTILECQLFLGSLDANADQIAMRETIQGALVQCARVRVLIHSMQDKMSEVDTHQEEQA